MSRLRPRVPKVGVAECRTAILNGCSDVNGCSVSKGVHPTLLIRPTAVEQTSWGVVDGTSLIDMFVRTLLISRAA
jgi:hypothetical protein